MPKLTDRQRHPYRQIYRRNRLTPEQQREANGKVVLFGILCFMMGGTMLFFSWLTGIKFR